MGESATRGASQLPDEDLTKDAIRDACCEALVPIVTRALSAGASGYVLKDAAPEELKLAVTLVLSGNKFFSPGLKVKPRLVKQCASTGSALTARERQVLELMTKGQSTQQVAQSLDLSPKTVETHRAHVMHKLGIFSIAGLTHYAIRHGFVQLGA